MRSLILLTAFTLSCPFGLAQAQRGAAKERSGVERKVAGSDGNLSPEVKAKPCTQERVRAYFDELAARMPARAVAQSRQVAQSPRIRNIARASTPDSGWLSQLRREVKSEVRSRLSDNQLLANLGDADIEALVFIVMMEAAQSAQDDLKAIMQGVKDINKEKEKERELNKEMESLRGKSSKLREDACLFIEQREKTAREGKKP
jgi:hypothetical protein